MDLKWPEIVTHIIGFVIALWILRRYAWTPILSMLEERRNCIQEEMDNTAADRREAADTLAGYQEKMKDIDSEARTKIQEAVREGQAVAAEVKDSARKEAQTFLDRAKEEIDREKAKAKIELRRDVVDLSLRAAEKLLGETLDEEKNRRLVDAFIEDLGGMK